MTHEERAHKFGFVICGDLPFDRMLEALAEQFREVERGAQLALREMLSTEQGRAGFALFNDLPLPEEMLAVRRQLREVVREGDALAGRLECFEWTGDSTPQKWPTPASVQETVAAWDAATKGIER